MKKGLAILNVKKGPFPVNYHWQAPSRFWSNQYWDLRGHPWRNPILKRLSMCGSEKKTACWITKNKERNITAVAKASHAPLSVNHGIELHAWPFLVLYMWFAVFFHTILKKFLIYYNKMKCSHTRLMIYIWPSLHVIQNHIKNWPICNWKKNTRKW